MQSKAIYSKNQLSLCVCVNDKCNEYMVNSKFIKIMNM